MSPEYYFGVLPSNMSTKTHMFHGELLSMKNIISPKNNMIDDWYDDIHDNNLSDDILFNSLLSFSVL